MIILLLFFRIHIEDNKYMEIKSLSLRKRVMIFFHSNKAISDFDIQLRNQWDDFVLSLEKNKKEGTLDVNFEENIEFCEFYLIKEKELPCFIVLDHQTISLFTKKDIVEAFNSKNLSLTQTGNQIQDTGNVQTVFYHLLLNYKEKNLLSTVCPSFNPKFANYPALVFHLKDFQQCKKIRKYKVFLPQISDHIYFSKEVSAGVFYYYHNENDYIIQKITKSKSLKIIRGYSFFPFDNFWSLPDIRQIKERRVAFIVYSSKYKYPLFDSITTNNQTNEKLDTQEIENKKLRNMIYNLSDYFWKDIVFNKMTLDAFNMLDVKMNESDTPFIFVTNLKKSKFIIIHNISIYNQERITTIMKQIRRGLYDTEMKLTFFPILSVFYENTRTLKNTLCFTFVALNVVAFTTFIIVKKASFCINPENEINYRRRRKF